MRQPGSLMNVGYYVDFELPPHGHGQQPRRQQLADKAATAFVDGEGVE
jgi:hypothetical protein